jgi:hypothetical protein
MPATRSKKLLMKKQFTLFCIALIAAAPICLGQASPSKADKSATKDAVIIDSEKAAWEAYKNKQADAFKKYLATDYCGVYADGMKEVDKEVANMEKSELRDYSLADMKVVFPSADVAVTTYKATLQGSSGGQDTSGTYNVASVWIKKGGKWLVIFHTDAKSQ